MSDGGTNFSGWAGGHKGEPSASALRRLGIPGKYHSAVKVAAGTTQSFNSESANYGYGAVMLGNGAGVTGTRIDLLGGGQIYGEDLTVKTIYEFAIDTVNAKTDDIYVFKVQR